MRLLVENFELIKKLGEEEALRLIREAGFDGIDYSYYWSKDIVDLLGENYREYAKYVKGLLEKYNLVCPQAHAPFDLCYGEQFNESEPHYLEIVRAMESASILGVKNIVVHAISIPDDVSDVSLEEYNLAFYNSLKPYCEKYNICVAVENLFDYDKKRKHYIGRIGSPKELCSIINKLSSPYFSACIDLGHASLTGFEPEDFLLNMDAKLISCLHIQDNDYLGDRHTLPFLGDLNWHKIIDALKTIDYHGDFTFEIFNYLKRIPNELLVEALNFAVAIGKYLISRFE